MSHAALLVDEGINRSPSLRPARNASNSSVTDGELPLSGQMKCLVVLGAIGGGKKVAVGLALSVTVTEPIEANRRVCTSKKPRGVLALM